MLVSSIRILRCVVAFSLAIGSKALESEDVVGLLPPEPKDVNETMAELVQDPVVRDAVQLAASNGSLNGLVVKRKTFVMPATEPDKVLSGREQVLLVPVEHLENVRKNITEPSHNKTITTNSLSLPDGFGNDRDQSTQSEESLPLSDEAEFVEERQADSGEGATRSPAKFDTRQFVPKFPPKNRPRTISVPVFAVVHRAATREDQPEAAVIAVLPEKPGNEEAAGGAEKQQQTRHKARQRIDGIATAAEPHGIWSFIATGAAQEENKWQDYPRGVMADMEVAEDIIFRPLFRYRKAQVARENSYRRSGYYQQPYGSHKPYSQKYRYRTRYPDTDYY